MVVTTEMVAVVVAVVVEVAVVMGAVVTPEMQQ